MYSGRALVIYRDRLSMGGSEKVLSALVDLFRSLNYFVTVITFGGSWNVDFMGPPPHLLVSTMPHVALDMLGRRRSRFVRGLYTLLYEELAKGSYDVVVDALYNDLRGAVDLGYVHFVYRQFPCRGLSPENAVSWILDTLYYRARARVIAANSTWTLRRIMKCGFEGVVVHPPVDPIRCPHVDKEDLVVGIGRLGKPWEEFIEVAKAVKAKEPNVKFVIMGSTDSQERVRYLETLGKGAVVVMPNVDEETKVNILCKSKVMLHTHPAEHFGISIVEGMYAGAIPIVHRDGGAWYDIVDRGRYGYGYDTVKEAVDAVMDALSNEDLRRVVVQRAEAFSRGVFKERIRRLLRL